MFERIVVQRDRQRESADLMRKLVSDEEPGWPAGVEVPDALGVPPRGMEGEKSVMYV